MESSPFRKLAPELRNQIYHLALQQPGDIHVDVGLVVRGTSTSQSSFRPSGVKARQRLKHALAPSRVCRTMRSECTKIFYHLNTFVLHPDHGLLGLGAIHHSLESGIGAANSAVTNARITELQPKTVGSGSSCSTELNTTLLYAMNTAERHAVHAPILRIKLSASISSWAFAARAANLQVLSSGPYIWPAVPPPASSAPFHPQPAGYIQSQQPFPVQATTSVLLSPLPPYASPYSVQPYAAPPTFHAPSHSYNSLPPPPAHIFSPSQGTVEFTLLLDMKNFSTSCASETERLEKEIGAVATDGTQPGEAHALGKIKAILDGLVPKFGGSMGGCKWL